ncbi:MAG: DMT family transporter [Pseudomonadota bacterium]
MTATRSAAQAGILAILAVTVLFVMMDTTAKWLSQSHHPFFVVWARYAGQAVGTLIFFAPRLRQVARTKRLGLQIFRSALLFGATLMFFSGFALMPMTEVAAISQIAPLFIMALAALVLGEKVGLYRWAAVLVGFVGAMVIVQPGTDAFQWAALLPVAGSLLFAGFSIATRYLGGADSTWTTFFYTGMVGAAVASLAVPFFWTMPSMANLPFLLLIGAFGAAGQAMLIVAMQLAPASLVAPFLYVQLIWAAAAGFVVFGEVPSVNTVIGAVMVVAAGLVVHWREQVLARRTAG